MYSCSEAGSPGSYNTQDMPLQEVQQEACGHLPLQEVQQEACEMQLQVLQDIEWSRYDIVECYMTMGGIPFYLSQLDEDLSYSANIDNLFFRQKGALWDEFQHLYRTLFRNSDLYVSFACAQLFGS